MSKNTQVSVKNAEVKDIAIAMAKIADKHPETLPLCTEYIQLAKRIRHYNVKETTKVAAIKRMAEIKTQILALKPSEQPALEPVKVQVEVKKTHTFGFNPKTGVQHSEEETILYLMREAYKVADQYPVKAQQLCRIALKKYINTQIIPQCKTPESVAAAKAKKSRIMEIFTANGFEKRDMTLKAAITRYGKQIADAVGDKVLQDIAFRAIEQAQKSFKKEQVTSR